HDEVVFLGAAQHAHVPRPVEDDGLEIRRAGLGRVRCRGRASEGLCVRNRRQPEHQRRGDCDARPVRSFSRGHGDLRSLFWQGAQLPPRLPRVVPSARTMYLRPPNGLPLRAGVNRTVISSPILSAFGPTFVIPALASAVAEPVVNVQSVVVPSSFLTVTVIDPCGFTNWSALSVPLTVSSLPGS